MSEILMMTPLIIRQLGQLRDKWPDATLEDVGNGTLLCAIPRLLLPKGWSKAETKICFIVPSGFPCDQPAYFWSDDDLLLASGGTPSQTDFRMWPGIPIGMRWWGYVPKSWNPNLDTLNTYVRFIQTRFFREV